MLKRLLRKGTKCLSKVKEKLSDEFQVVYIKNPVNTEKLYSLLTNPKRILPVIKARIDENNEIHIIIKDIYGVFYITKTTEYKWFLNNFSINQT